MRKGLTYNICIKYFLIFLLSLLLSALSSCTPISFLDEESVTQGDAFKVKIELKKSYNSNHQRYDFIFVRLTDKNGGGVELEQGSVSVNGKKMEFYRWLFGPTQYELKSYQLDLLIPDSLYTFNISVNDTLHYYAKIRLPQIDIASFTMPGSHSRTEPLHIRWNEQNTVCPTKIKYKYTFVKPNQNTASTDEIYFYPDQPWDGYFIIDSYYLNIEPNIRSAEISVISDADGELDPRLTSGGSIRAWFETSRSVSFTD